MPTSGFFLYGASNAATGRLLQHLFPTPLEKAQIRSLSEQIDHARARLASEEARTKRDLDERWAMLQTQLAHQQKLQDEQIDADRNLRGYQKQLDQWPIAAPAASILGASRRRPVPTLNAFVKVTDGREPAKLDPLMQAIRQLDLAARRFLGDDILLYCDGPSLGGDAMVSRPNPLWGQALVSTMNDVLFTEPTVFLEVSGEEGVVTVDGAFWGWPCETGPRRNIARRAPAPLILELDADAAVTQRQILDTLLLLIVGIYDAFTLLNRWEGRNPLRLFRALAELGATGGSGPPEGDSPIAEMRRLIGELAASAPPLAAEAAAHAAIEAQRAGFDAHASLMLDQALEHARAAIAGAPADNAELMTALMAIPRKDHGLIQQAIAELRGVAAAVPPPPPPRLSLNEVAASLNRRLRER